MNNHIAIVEITMTKRILCAIDGTEHAKPAIDLAADMAKGLGATLTLCSVNVLTGGIKGPAIYLHDEAEMATILAQACDAAKARGLERVETQVLKARDVAIAIVQHADANNFDHIVTGTGSKNSLTRFALGSVATDIVHRAHCPVTVAR
jgi:nucleotide-binding universal stress UspA family protein